MEKENLILKPHPGNTCGRSYNLLNVKLLNQCNGRCTFCIADGTYCAETADVNKFISIVNGLEKFKKVDVLGGEPTLYKDLEVFLKGIRPHKEEIGIISNASNIPLLMKCLPYLDTITLSIHSFEEGRNATGIKVDLDGLSALNSMKGKTETIAATVITDETTADLRGMEEYAEKAKELGFSAVKFMELVTSNDRVHFIDLQDMLKEFDIHQKNATLRGCFFELPGLSEHLGIKAYIKLCCPYNNIFKAMDFGIPTIEYQHDYINVVQPDGVVTDSWVYEKFENKVLNGGKYNVNYLAEK